MTNEKNEQAVEETVEVSKAKNTKTAAASSHDDFDWGADEAGFESYSNDERKRLEDAYNSTFQPVVEKQVVKGVVVGMNEKDVVVNIGFKSDGLVPRTEFRDVPNLALGDEVEVFVDIAEDKMGQLILSRKKALQETAWEKSWKHTTTIPSLQVMCVQEPKVVWLWMYSVSIRSFLALKSIPNLFVTTISM